MISVSSEFARTTASNQLEYGSGTFLETFFSSAIRGFNICAAQAHYLRLSNRNSLEPSPRPMSFPPSDPYVRRPT